MGPIHGDCDLGRASCDSARKEQGRGTHAMGTRPKRVTMPAEGLGAERSKADPEREHVEKI